MYQVKCDGYPLLDLRNDELILMNPKVKVEVNTVGEGSFTIYKSHPYYDKIKRLKSVFEVSDEVGVIFRGRMTNDSIDFDNGKAVDLEGAMAYFNDTTVRPYSFPNDFIEDASYIEAAENGNVVEFFLNWLIKEHNSKVQEYQQFKLGTVTVKDENNYITREDSNYTKTWDILKSKLFESALGGYLCIRYEEDGNYIDYLSEFTLTNTQSIEFGKNLLDLKRETDGSETYSAIIPIGAEIEIENETDPGEETEETETTTTKVRITLASLPDGDITDDIVKVGDTLYSKSAVEKYGWIEAPIGDTTWEDVTDANNLLTRASAYLQGTAVMLSDTVEFTAIDLHFTDEQIQSFRIYRNIKATSVPHGLSDTLLLTKLDVDLLNAQNTKITVGKTKLTLTEANNKYQSDSIQRIESAEKDIEENRTNVTEVKEQILTQSTSIINDCERIILAALESYVETGIYEEFKETVSTQLEIMAGEITMNFTTTTEQITNVDGDLQNKFNELYKYISMSDEGIVIKSSDSQIELQLDNEAGIIFKKNGVQFGWWDGVDFHTGNIVVEVNERAQFGNFAFIPRSDGSLSFLKVSD